jgi:hypothetical protein
MAPIAVRRVAVTDEVSATDTLPEPHYAAQFELSLGHASARSPEHWARATFEDAPAALRWFIRTGWRLGLGFRLGPASSPDHVLGCRIAHSGPEVIILEQRSPLMTAHNLVLTRDARVVWATFVRYHRPAARPLWSVSALIHHRTLPYLLEHAAR